MSASLGLRGGFLITSFSGGLNPSAVAGGPSVTRLTQSSWTGMSPSGIPKAAVKKILTTSPMLDEIMYLMKAFMLLKIPLPSATAVTMVLKLSSARIMSLASLATSVPDIPIATPMSANFSAGASFTPSPVMATTPPQFLSIRTMSCLCLGSALENTSPPWPDRRLIWSFMDILTNSEHVTDLVSTSWSLSNMPMFFATASAVFLLSPVIIITRIPADLHSIMLFETSGRGGSLMPTNPTKVKPSSSFS
mmetsp:Transcript_7963/g.49175  ORF Transcript_7963/g.49175 Transcript_7963/m.49175 type:complete len:249 (+) Transcript_7963:1120-1866(+)